ncbi:hypothetical protein C5Y96_23190 [Blastopirellula marina]|uniref:Uncharacterized protein n=1 Tax=Blastopirellula marina TaxID=124 RepID=A0A2S8F0Q2_9BACT|nr:MULTISPECIES: hypothetical protein [Pirellulaceae]PQO25720.1 hypothetical protein C5Y96_23190 [Blastopirellula marina]RCS43403.1 hypothetical protein DTL36_23240 [Bremerella cremea]
MNSAHDQHESNRAFSLENAPAVIVRARKTFVCSSCGTLVKIPAEAVGHLAYAFDSSPQEQLAIIPANPPTTVSGPP